MKFIKPYVLFLFLTSLNTALYAQKQFNNWYFGNNVGLNFNIIPPVALTNGKSNSVEGCASISDNNGNLLFYSNGTSIYNRQHNVMVNGSSIDGDPSSTCNVLILPLPGNDSIYYLFTIGASGQGLKGFRYSIVDIRKQGGLGEVTVKNYLIRDDSFEKIAAVRHCNKKDAWITVRTWESDEYNTYLFTASGLNNSPVSSHTGLVIGGYVNNGIGAMKFSSDGKKLAAVHSFQNDCVELMDFDNETGIISNPVVIKPNTVPPLYTGVYGIEFSPDNKLLYVSSNNSDTDPSTLYQFNISSPNAVAIMATKQIIAQNSPWFGGALQMGPDKKIYYALWKDTSISVIDNPNVYGSGCNFQFNKIFLSRIINDPTQFGLPSFIASDIDYQFAPFDFSRLGGDCRDFDVTFQLNRTNGIDSVLWDFGDGQQSSILAPFHHYLLPGNYLVKLIIYTPTCTGNSEFVSHRIFLSTDNNKFLPADTAVCSIKNYQVNPAVTGLNYLWSTGATTPFIKISNTGVYWLEINNDGCISRDTMVITQKPTLVVDLGNDTSFCSNNKLVLNAALQGVSFLWNDGSTSASLEINKPGLYSVKVSSADACEAIDSVIVEWGDCDFLLPNAFSPNGDGNNDEFGLVNGINAKPFAMKIYNRYGQVIFSSSDPSRKWDGRFKNKPSPVGLYPWIVSYTNKNGYPRFETGTVLLIR